MMQVLRLEMGDGTGVYDSCAWLDCCGRPTENEYHPGPDSDQKLFIGMRVYAQSEHGENIRYRPVYDYDYMTRIFSNHRFGFLNKQQFLQWVYDPKWRRRLQDRGVELNIYEMDEKHCLVGNSQVLFDRTQATLVESLPVDIYDRV